MSIRLNGNRLLLNTCKVNFDASWTKEQNGVGVKVVIWDNRGEFYAGLSKLGRRVSLVAALEAINFALCAEFRDIVLEGNNLLMLGLGRMFWHPEVLLWQTFAVCGDIVTGWPFLLSKEREIV